MMTNIILNIKPLRFSWKTKDSFLLYMQTKRRN